MPVGAAEALGESNDVSLVSAVRYDRAKLQAGSEVDVNGVDPATIADGYRFEWKQGSDGVLAGLGTDGAVIRDDLAEDQGSRSAIRCASRRRRARRSRSSSGASTSPRSSIHSSVRS